MKKTQKDIIKEEKQCVCERETERINTVCFTNLGKLHLLVVQF